MESPTDISSARKFRCSLPHFFSGKRQKSYNKRILDLIIYQTGEKFGLDCKHFVLYVMNKKLTHMSLYISEGSSNTVETRSMDTCVLRIPIYI